MSLLPIRVASGAPYFETTDGKSFLFIGPNDSISWPGLAGLYRRRDRESVERYLADLSANGVTILRLMLEYAERDSWYFERRVGEFNPNMVRLWDDLFSLCEQYGIRVLLTPWDTFWMSRRWNQHPYNTKNGGPAKGPSSFLTDEATIAATVRRLTFVIERWGGSGVLAAWDLFNEIDPYWGGTPEEQGRAISRISQEVRAVEERVGGFTRPQTVSIFGPEPPREYEDLIFRHPDLDFASTHIYHSESIDYPRDTVRPALTMTHWVRYARARVPQGRPYLDSEHGPIHLFNDHQQYLDEPFDDEYERHMIWAHLAAGGAGSGMRWPARHPHLLTPGMRQSLRVLARFATAVDWSRLNPGEADICLTVEDGTLHRFGVQDDRQGFFYLLRGVPPGHTGSLIDLHALMNRVLTVGGFKEGPYSVQVLRTDCDEQPLRITDLKKDAAGRLHIPLPPIVRDIAITVCPDKPAG